MKTASGFVHTVLTRSVFRRVFAALVAAAFVGGLIQAQEPAPSAAAILSAKNSVTYLRTVMDQYHNRFPVYDDISSPGNHFHAWAKIPDGNAPVDINATWTDRPRSGATSIRAVFTPHRPFGGFYFQNGTLMGDQVSPQRNFGEVPNAGFDLRGATHLTFWVRGNAGGERIEFFVAGVGREARTGTPIAPYPDSSPRRPAVGTVVTLTRNWQQFVIDLAGMDLSYVLGGFGWVADSTNNPGGAVFFLDDIQFNLSTAARKQRLDQPRLLRSFTTLPLQPDPFDEQPDGDIDFVLRNLAFTYDNALAVLAFLGDGSVDSVRRAGLIGDAFVYALAHDRTYNDNRACTASVDPRTPDGARLRSAYTAGDLGLPPGWMPNGRAGTVPIPGFYAEATKTFYEVEQQALDSGNNLWAIVALTALYERTGQARYLDAACKLGNFVRAFRNDVGTFRGFTGGVDSPEGLSPVRRMWASTEHNLDANAAFTRLFQLTGDARWQQDAAHARQFVEAMWDGACYRAGTMDPGTRNHVAGQLPLDVQTWSLLALPAPLPHPGALACAEANHLTSSGGLTGVDFNEDRDGVWLEGTAQMAVAEARANRPAMAEQLRAQLRFAQQTAPFGNRTGIASASHDGLSTGFLTAGGYVFKYFRRLHIAVAAWNVFGQLDLNPYYSRRLTVGVFGRGSVAVGALGACRTTCASAWIDGATVTLTAKPTAGWAIGSWSGVCAGAAAQCVVRLREAQATTVTFVPL